MKTQFDDDVVGARASPVDATPTQSFESSPTDSWAQRDTTFQASTCVSQSEERVDLARRAHEKGNMRGGDDAILAYSSAGRFCSSWSCEMWSLGGRRAHTGAARSIFASARDWGGRRGAHARAGWKTLTTKECSDLFFVNTATMHSLPPAIRSQRDQR